jgi:hypothetical protein
MKCYIALKDVAPLRMRGDSSMGFSRNPLTSVKWCGRFARAADAKLKSTYSK